MPLWRSKAEAVRSPGTDFGRTKPIGRGPPLRQTAVRFKKSRDLNRMPVFGERPGSPLHVAREGADHAVLAAVLVAALERDVLGLAQPARRGVAVRATRPVGVDRERGAAALEHHHHL